MATDEKRTPDASPGSTEPAPSGAPGSTESAPSDASGSTESAPSDASGRPTPESVNGAEKPQALEGRAEQEFFQQEAAGDSEIDPELVRLPRRRRRRHPLISLAVIGLSLYLMWFVREDLFFLFQPRRPVDLGDGGQALREGKLRPNRHVTLSGAPDRKHSLILEARFGGYDSFFRLQECADRVFVQQHRDTRATDEIVTGSNSGQIVRFRSLPYHKSLGAYLSRTMNTPHELDYAEVARAKQGGGSRVATVKDKSGATLELNPDSLIWINVVYPGEWLIQFSKRFITKIEDARKHLEGLDLPIVEDDEESATFYRFVVHAEPDQLPLLMARCKNPALHADVILRQVAYSARWDQLNVQGKVLLINAADSTFPTRYQVKRTGAQGPATLIAVKEMPVPVPAEAIHFITTSTPFSIAPDALVLLTGKTPGDNWYYVVLYLLLLTFIILNSLSLVTRLRESAEDHQGARS
jgi:hypothetical protein